MSHHYFLNNSHGGNQPPSNTTQGPAYGRPSISYRLENPRDSFNVERRSQTYSNPSSSRDATQSMTPEEALRMLYPTPRDYNAALRRIEERQPTLESLTNEMCTHTEDFMDSVDDLQKAYDIITDTSSSPEQVESARRNFKPLKAQVKRRWKRVDDNWKEIHTRVTQDRPYYEDWLIGLDNDYAPSLEKWNSIQDLL